MKREDIIRMLALLRAGIYIRENRRRPRVDFSSYEVTTEDGVTIHCTLMGNDPDKCVIVAHPFGVGSTYKDIVLLSESLSEKFSVVTFDFRGHGKSSGTYNPGFAGICLDMKKVLDNVRRRGFEKLAIVGFSLGAAAGVLCASGPIPVDALVCLGCPPRLPELPGMGKHRLLSKILLRGIGVRLGNRIEHHPTPEEFASALPPIPKFFIFGEIEVFPRDVIEDFYSSVSEPKEILYTPGGWHASLEGNENLVKEWLERNL